MLSALAVLAFCILTVHSANFTNCSTDMEALEFALYKYTPENLRQLNRIFYPPRRTPSRFVKVRYHFEGSEHCKVTYIWAIGGFLLVQPPKIFQLTSLYFSTPANSLTDLAIQLPRECLGLVGGDDNCTCKHENGKILDILTQQVRSICMCQSLDTSMHN